MTVEVDTFHRVSYSRGLFIRWDNDITTVLGWMYVVLLLYVIDFIVVVVVLYHTDVPASLLLFAPVSVWMEIESNRGVVLSSNNGRGVSYLLSISLCF
mmetsp:Transcript_12776/g.14170  ORF Transcript_12776/g.14170 Transcript_12776/m.14170 type:complete len:98 (-) Transcript_12776:61-354(-)